MRVVITAKENGNGAAFDSRFGRCAYLALYETGKGYVMSFENKAAEATGGAGIAAGRHVGELDADVLITGHLGPNAATAIKEIGVKVFYGSFGNITEAFNEYEAGHLTEVISI